MESATSIPSPKSNPMIPARPFGSGVVNLTMTGFCSSRRNPSKMSSVTF